MGRSMAQIAHQPGPVCLEGGVRRWLVGGVVLGGGATPAPTRGAWGASSIRVPKKNARCPGLPPQKAWPGWLSYVPCSREGQGEQSRCFSQPTQASPNVQEENLSCARDQVEIARPPALTPPWRYRRSLVSKGCFTISINVICVWECIRSSLPKRRYRVVIGYVGDLLRHRGKAGCRLFRGL
jgi:hypothetical protein